MEVEYAELIAMLENFRISLTSSQIAPEECEDLRVIVKRLVENFQWDSLERFVLRCAEKGDTAYGATPSIVPGAVSTVRLIRGDEETTKRTKDSDAMEELKLLTEALLEEARKKSVKSASD